MRLGQAESGGIVLAAVYWARAPRVVLPDRALCLPTFCHSLLTVNKSSSSSSSVCSSVIGHEVDYLEDHKCRRASRDRGRARQAASASGIVRWRSEGACLIVFTITNGPCSASPPPVVCVCTYVCMIIYSCLDVLVWSLFRLTGTLGYASLLGTIKHYL